MDFIFHLLEKAQNLLTSNQMLSGGIMLTAIGVVIAYLRNLPSRTVKVIADQLVSVVTIEGRDELFNWIDAYLTTKTPKKRRSLAVTRKQRAIGEVVHYEYENKQRKDIRPKVELTPAKGSNHWIKYKGTWINFTRHSDGSKDTSKSGSPDLSSFYPALDNYYLTFFTRNQNKIIDFLLECRDYANPIDERVVMRISSYDCWKVADYSLLRELDSVVLPDGQAENLLADLVAFRSRAAHYKSLGVPHRRGYLLYGPPGNGKSSLIAGIACRLHMNINILRLSCNSMSDNALVNLLNDTDINTILVVEDLDCITAGRTVGTEKSFLSFSGLLNALDGLQAKDGRIIFMTSNHIENLDPALIRPGRVDMKLLIGNATKGQAMRLYERFFPGQLYDSKIFDSINSGEFSMSDLQNIFVSNMEHPDKITAESFYKSSRSRQQLTV